MEASGSAGTINVGAQSGTSGVDISGVSFSDKFTKAVMGTSAGGSSDAASVTLTGALMAKLLTGSITGDAYDTVTVGGSTGLEDAVDMTKAGSVVVDLSSYKGTLSSLTLPETGHVVLTKSQYSDVTGAYAAGSVVELSEVVTDMAVSAGSGGETLLLASGANSLTAKLSATAEAESKFILQTAGGDNSIALSGTDNTTATLGTTTNQVDTISIAGGNGTDSVTSDLSVIRVKTLSLDGVENFKMTGTTTSDGIPRLDVWKSIDLGDSSVDFGNIQFQFRTGSMDATDDKIVDVSFASLNSGVHALAVGDSTNKAVLTGGSANDYLCGFNTAADSKDVTLVGGDGGDWLERGTLMFAGSRTELSSGVYAEGTDTITVADEHVNAIALHDDGDVDVSTKGQAFLKSHNVLDGITGSRMVLSDKADTILIQNSAEVENSVDAEIPPSTLTVDNFRIGQDSILLMCNADQITEGAGTKTDTSCRTSADFTDSSAWSSASEETPAGLTWSASNKTLTITWANLSGFTSDKLNSSEGSARTAITFSNLLNSDGTAYSAEVGDDASAVTLAGLFIAHTGDDVVTAE